MGRSDCEALQGGWLAQPVNAWSSLAFAVAAAFVLLLARRAPRRSRPLLVAGGLALIFVALGSAAYHGPQPWWARPAHDASIAAVLAVHIVGAVGASREESVARARTISGAAALGVPVVVVVPSSALAVHAALAATVALVEAAAGHRDGPGGTPPARRVALWALAAGAALFVLGRTGGPLCSPPSLLQPHAAWHLLAAVAAAAALVARARHGQVLHRDGRDGMAHGSSRRS